MKFYEKILKNTRRFFGMDSEASEAEVDQKLEEAGTLEAFQASIKASIEASMQRELDELNAEKESLESINQQQAEKIDQLQQVINEANQKISEMQARIDELEKKPAVDHTSGNSSDDGKAKEPLWMRNPINRKVASIYASKNKPE